MTTFNNLRRVMAVTAVTVALAGCEFIDPVTSNPNAVPEATVDQLFTGIQVNTYFLGVGGLSRISAIWTQQMAGTDRQFIQFDNYTINEQDFDDEMDALYTGGGLVDLRQAIALAEAAGRNPYAGILKIHEAFMVGTVASFYGDIPYSEAVSGIDNPALDNMVDVYAAIDALLVEAIANLGASGSGPGSVDLAFGGNAARWIAVANTLRARYQLHWAEVGGAARYVAARTAAQSGITTSAGNWRAQFSTAATENNLWYQFERDRSGYVSAGDQLVPMMVNATDPRTAQYFADSPPVARTSNLSTTGYGAPGFDFPLVTCSERNFIIAEAELMDGTPDEAAARAAARAAQACQESFWGLAADALGSATGFAQTGAALFNAIMDQKYVAQFLNVDAYSDYKRTCRPALAGATGMPGRVFYSINERQANTSVPNPGTDPNDTYNDNDPNRCP